MVFTNRTKANNTRIQNAKNRQAAQQIRSCSACHKQGVSPCQSLSVHRAKWCPGVSKHICNYYGHLLCYPCANKKFTSPLGRKKASRNNKIFPGFFFGLSVKGLLDIWEPTAWGKVGVPAMPRPAPTPAPPGFGSLYSLHTHCTLYSYLSRYQ